MTKEFANDTDPTAPVIERHNPSSMISYKVGELVIAFTVIASTCFLILIIYIFYKLCFRKLKLWASRSNSRLDLWTYDREAVQRWRDEIQSNQPYPLAIGRDLVNLQTSSHFRPASFRTNEDVRTSSRLSRVSNVLREGRWNRRPSSARTSSHIYSVQNEDLPMPYVGHIPASTRLNASVGQCPSKDLYGPYHQPRFCMDHKNHRWNNDYRDWEEEVPLGVDNPLFDEYDETPRKLLTPIERSQILEVDGKLIVYITREVDSKGAILILDNMGISLSVPAGAVADHQKQLIILALNWDLSDNPFMENRQALVSPVVYCGPHGVKLRSPALLRYKHCAFDSRDIQIMESETELTGNKQWEVYCQAVEDERKCKVTQDECQILIDHFTLFTSIQTPQNGDGHKWLQIAVFSSPLKPGIEHYSLRVYFLNKTPCALQWAKHNEAQFEGELVCPEKVFLLKGNREDAILELLYLSHDWESVNQTQNEHVKFQKIWHGMCPRAEFCFHRDLAGNVPKEINLNFAVFQKSGENEADKIVIQMAETTGKRFTPLCQTNQNGFQEVKVRVIRPSSGKMNRRPESGNSDQMSVTVRRGGQPVDGSNVMDVEINPGQLCVEEYLNSSLRLEDVRPHIKTKIPLETKRQLVLLLAPIKQIGSDWRDFAAALGFDCIPFLQTLSCPTTALLEFFETQPASLMVLHDIFLKIDRKDAASVIAGIIGTVPKRMCEHSESDSDINY
ncbi:hypothetical protein LOTGIDRAFT_165101 [Lottia gigantea]|uniref:Netrin receptor UNC5 n=1 Tax=Lottia gigantea TaxID=225164 RepID=V4BLH3_LOTGI|nr:hypothetical protein LOTGIDRAFT_165101 [Lottia gigantea]ESO89509.1 hypothetical protein LOTGIDRAFT_165101 [Lottia gigantea]